MKLLKRTDKPIFHEGDRIKIHFNESGFDNFIEGNIRFWISNGIAISTERSIFYIPFGRILYVEKEALK
jgi:hypothetical protein